MFDLPHVASRAFGTPLMIARPKLETILGVLGPRLAGNALSPIEPEADPPPRTSITVERIAVVSVIGTLVSRSGYLDAAGGMPPTPTDEPGLVAAGRIDCLDEDDDRCLGALVAALVFDASIDQAAEKTAKHAQLAKAGIVPRETA